MELQTDQFGVVPEGQIEPSDLADIGARLLAKDVYIQRLRQRLLELGALLGTYQKKQDEALVEAVASEIAPGRSNGKAAPKELPVNTPSPPRP